MDDQSHTGRAAIDFSGGAKDGPDSQGWKRREHRALLEQQLHALSVAGVARKHEWRQTQLAVLVDAVHIGAGLQKELRAFVVACLARPT